MYICNTKEKDMRQFLLLLISSLFLTSCTEQYNIAGNSTVPVLDGRMLYLKVTPNGVTSENIDSCKVIQLLWGRGFYRTCASVYGERECDAYRLREW